jgi:hypothetical protein
MAEEVESEPRKLIYKLQLAPSGLRDSRIIGM